MELWIYGLIVNVIIIDSNTSCVKNWNARGNVTCVVLLLACYTRTRIRTNKNS